MDLVLFDLDGTLAQTYYGDDNSYMTSLSEMLPLDPNYKYWKDCPHLTDSAVMNHIYQFVANRAPSATEIAAMKRNFLNRLIEKREQHPEFFAEIPGAAETVAQLKAENHLVGVATGGWADVARFKLHNINVDPEDLHLIGSDDHFAKHDFVRALIDDISAAGHRLEKITYVGDSLYDMGVAKELGLDFIGVDFKGEGYLQEAGVEKIVPHYQSTAFREFLSA